MTRYYTPLVKKESPKFDTSRSRKAHYQSPVTPTSGGSRKRFTETSSRSACKHAYSRPAGKEPRRSSASDTLWQLGRSVQHEDGESDEDDDAGGESSGESDWDEEETLVAILHDSPRGPKAQTSDGALVDSLEPAFAEASQARKEEMVEVLLPTVRRVREAVVQLRGRDEKLAEGILGLAKVCREFEEKEVDDGGVEKVLARSKAKIATLLEDLQERYARRAKIRENFEVKLKAKAEAMREQVNTFPKERENLIASFEKKSQQFDKEDANAVQKITGQAKDMLEKDSSAFELF